MTVRAGEWLMARFEIPIPYESVESSSFAFGLAGNGIGGAIAQVRILLRHGFLLEKSLAEYSRCRRIYLEFLRSGPRKKSATGRCRLISFSSGSSGGSGMNCSWQSGQMNGSSPGDNNQYWKIHPHLLSGLVGLGQLLTVQLQ